MNETITHCAIKNQGAYNQDNIEPPRGLGGALYKSLTVKKRISYFLGDALAGRVKNTQVPLPLLLSSHICPPILPEFDSCRPFFDLEKS
jgi:hypothetical protein